MTGRSVPFGLAGMNTETPDETREFRYDSADELQ